MRTLFLRGCAAADGRGVGGTASPGRAVGWGSGAAHHQHDSGKRGDAARGSATPADPALSATRWGRQASTRGRRGDAGKRCASATGRTRGPREPTVIVTMIQHRPSFMLLTKDKSATDLMLGFNGIEGLFQTFFGRLASINGASLRVAHTLTERRGTQEIKFQPNFQGFGVCSD